MKTYPLKPDTVNRLRFKQFCHRNARRYGRKFHPPFVLGGLLGRYFSDAELFEDSARIHFVGSHQNDKLNNIDSSFATFYFRNKGLTASKFFCRFNLSQPGLGASFTQELDEVIVYLTENCF